MTVLGILYCISQSSVSVSLLPCSEDKDNSYSSQVCPVLEQMLIEYVLNCKLRCPFNNVFILWK